MGLYVRRVPNILIRPVLQFLPQKFPFHQTDLIFLATGTKVLRETRKSQEVEFAKKKLEMSQGNRLN